MLATHHQLERRLQNHDEQILALVEAIRQLMEEPEDPPKPRIGFATELDIPANPERTASLKKARKRT